MLQMSGIVGAAAAVLEGLGAGDAIEAWKVGGLIDRDKAVIGVMFKHNEFATHRRFFVLK
jgi:hypothetical protein